jgi:ribonuclease BN (tRNA processing enzyme)
MEITFLGSGNAFASEGRYWSSFIVDRRCQFDAPPTLLPHLKRLQYDLSAIEAVFLTHHHGDHFMGLPFLMLEYVYMTRRTHDLYIVGPPGVQEWMEDFANRCYPELASRDAGYRRIYIDSDPDAEIQMAGSIAFRAIPMNHVVDSMQAFGYRVKIDGKTVAYTGDTMFCEEIFQLAEGADVLVVDCTYTDGSGPEHMGIDDVRAIRKRLPADITMVLTHLTGKPLLNGLANTILAEDLKTLRFD